MAKKFNFKRILSLVMAFTMATSLLPMGALAAGSDDATCRIAKHVHVTDCYHQHTDGCYNIDNCSPDAKTLNCDESKHHTDGCKHVCTSECAEPCTLKDTYVCGGHAADHDDSCYIHEHDASCKDSNADCGKEENVTVECTSAFAEGDTDGYFYYASLAAAITEANKDKSDNPIVIELLKDTTFDKKMTISRDITITGDFTVTRDDAYTGTLFTVEKGATLTLEDLTIDGGNNWTFDKEGYMDILMAGNKCAANQYFATNEEGAPVATAPMIVVNGTATLGNGATIQNNSGKEVFQVNNGAVLNTLDGSVLTHNTKNTSSAITALKEGGTWNIEGGKIYDNHSVGHGVVSYAYGNIYMNGGEIYENYGSDTNGSVFITREYFEMNGGKIHHNYALMSPANSNNGAIYVYHDGKFVMNDGEISENYGSQPSGIVSNCTSATATANTILNGGKVDGGIAGTGFKGHDVTMVNPVHVTDDMIVGESRIYNDITVDKGKTYDANHVYFHGWIVDEIGTQDYTGGGNIDANITLYAGAEAVHHEGSWVNGLVTVDAVGTGTTLTVKPDATIDGVQVRVLNSVASGDYQNADESAAAQAASYVEEDGATVKSPVLFYHRLTADQKQTTVTTDDGTTETQPKIVVTFDYNGGLDAQGWSGCQIASDDAFTPTAPTPTREGYILAGWNYAVDNDPECLTMEGNTPYEKDEISKSLRLIAQWTKDPSIPDPIVPVEPEQKIPVNKTADGLDANDQTNVTLSVPGDSKDLSSDIVLIIGDGALEVTNYIIDLVKQILVSTDGTPTKIKLGFVTYADTTAKETALPLTVVDDNGGENDVDTVIATALETAKANRGGVNMESALITARDMLAADTSVPAERKHMIIVSTGLTYWFDNDDGKGSFTVRADASGTPQHVNYKYWLQHRNGTTSTSNGYCIPSAYKSDSNTWKDAWDAYWNDIVSWIVKDQDNYVYSVRDSYSDFLSRAGKNATITDAEDLALVNKKDDKYVLAPYAVGSDKVISENEQHAVGYERAQYEAWVVYNEMQTPIGKSFTTALGDTVNGLGFNCYAVANGVSSNPGEEDRWLNSNQIGYNFMQQLAGGKAVHYRDQDKSFFDPIANEILYSVSAGSYVEDYIGYDAEKGNFNFIQSKDAISLKVGDATYATKNVTAKNGATSSYTFTKDGNTEPTFWLDYYEGNGTTTEKFIWTFGENVSLAAPVSLTYKLQLTEKATVAGDYEVETNESATLYPKGGTEQKFPVPTVTYTVSGGSTGGGGGGGGGGVVDIPLAPIPEAFTADHYAYIIGYPKDYETGERTKDQTRMPVEPQGNITRAEVATIFFRLLDDQVRELNMVSKNDFSDVNKGQWFNNAISTMASMGIVNGYPDGTFRPNGKITRAEFAAIAARFNASASTDGDYFTDIAGHWGEDEIYKATNSGWIKGYEDNTFKPNQLIIRAEAMTLVNRVLHRLPETIDDLHDDMLKWVDNMDTSKWYYLAVQEATNSHDYTRDPSNIDYETWTEMREARDWSELEY